MSLKLRLVFFVGVSTERQDLTSFVIPLLYICRPVADQSEQVCKQQHHWHTYVCGDGETAAAPSGCVGTGMASEMGVCSDSKFTTQDACRKDVVTHVMETTKPIDYNASAAAMRDSLQALHGVGWLEVERMGPFPNQAYRWTVRWVSRLGDRPPLVADASGLIHGIGSRVTVSELNGNTAAIGGTFSVGYRGLAGDEECLWDLQCWTPSLSMEVTASEMRAALEMLPTVEFADVKRRAVWDGGQKCVAFISTVRLVRMWEIDYYVLLMHSIYAHFKKNHTLAKKKCGDLSTICLVRYTWDVSFRPTTYPNKDHRIGNTLFILLEYILVVLWLFCIQSFIWTLHLSFSLSLSLSLSPSLPF